MDEEQEIFINGLPLPQSLLDLITAGRWEPIADKEKIAQLFNYSGELTFYSLEYMPFENKHWFDETEPMFIGAPDDSNAPGDIDPHLSVLIGDLGIGSDQPIALDYRVSMSEPRVLTLLWLYDQEAKVWGSANRLVEVAPNISRFAELLGL